MVTVPPNQIIIIIVYFIADGEQPFKFQYVLSWRIGRKDDDKMEDV